MGRRSKMKIARQLSKKEKITTQSLIFILVLAGLYVASLKNYLLFHGLAEGFSIVVACGIFMLVWNSRRFLNNDLLLFLGIAYLFIGMMDFVHTLAYKGMGVFPGHGANLPTQLWIATRFMESITFLLAPLFFKRRLIPVAAFVCYTAVTSILLCSIFLWDIFPACFIEGSGLTPFKKTSEYIISLILLASSGFFFLNRRNFDRTVFLYLTASIGLTIASELSFTFYVSVYGISNLLGHFFKIVSFYFIYKSVIEIGLSKPYDLLFRDLKQSEEALRKQTRELKDALGRVKTLSGLLPICSSCKKIRDDRGYWNQVEVYFRDHSEAEFTHSICPDCMKKLYPGYYKKGGKS